MSISDPVMTSSQEGLVYVKQFFVGEFEDTFKLTNELRAYAALKSLQAVGIPLCIGRTIQYNRMPIKLLLLCT
jgi:hypothetical protein